MLTHEDAQPRDRRPWTEEEDEKLLAAIEEEDPDSNPPSRWHAIAQHIPGRTNKDCRKRWWAQMATVVSKGSWTSDEDERLANAVEELGPKWAMVASRVRTRNSGQCAKRWNDALNPLIDRSGWTKEEDDTLLKAVDEMGHAWANIARTYIPGRTGLAAKNRYNHLLRGSDRGSGSRGRRNSTVTSTSRRRTRAMSTASLSGSVCVASPTSSSLTSRSSPEASLPPTTPPPAELEAIASGATSALLKPKVLGSALDPSHISREGSLGPFTPPIAPDSQFMDLFMSDTFSNFSSTASTSFLDQMSSESLCDSPAGLDELQSMQLLSPWANVLSGVGSCDLAESFPGTSQQLPAAGQLPTMSNALDLAALHASFSMGGTDYLTSSAAPSQLATPALSPPLLDFPEAQVTIGGVPTFPDRARIQITQPTADLSNRRVAVAVAICDRQDIGSTVQSLSHSLSSILTQGSTPQ